MHRSGMRVFGKGEFLPERKFLALVNKGDCTAPDYSDLYAGSVVGKCGTFTQGEESNTTSSNSALSSLYHNSFTIQRTAKEWRQIQRKA